MESTSIAARGCLIAGHADHHLTYAELTGAYWLDPPIYSELVADWRGAGRTVPRRTGADEPEPDPLSGGSRPRPQPGTEPVPPR
ncbi:hypothetical protein ABZ883_01250 [Streptomyces sp. NPDC046977]|uniref:hypothetical protein n=1 Tax=Streptomyces sp. NPDC046977 TaxID=3154703 RepID=UPI0033FECC55